ncbi:hypothetical protein ATO3_08920 [Marinibacterium profundimaris]|uniref:Permease n=1 Tax=Marinibacterium profundimaris TaxID=1679460 RepID=A0A225NQP8_9RHOB|nr:hypothetical protein ATO3_08920 [Marinibacterium profundimaris]
MAATKATLAFTLPRIVVALVGAGLFAELLPDDQVQAFFGADGGWKGILLAACLGPPTPGGAFVSFAIGAAALKAGASVPAVLTYVTSWALFSTTKILTYEIPMMGARAMWLRVALSWPIPFIVGAVVLLIG